MFCSKSLIKHLKYECHNSPQLKYLFCDQIVKQYTGTFAYKNTQNTNACQGI